MKHLVYWCLCIFFSNTTEDSNPLVWAVKDTGDPVRHLFANSSFRYCNWCTKWEQKLKSLHFAFWDPGTLCVDFWDSKLHIAVASETNGYAGMQSYSATWEYWGLLQGKEHVKSSLINQCLGTDGMAIWALITASWDRGSQTLMRFNKMNDYTAITIRETCKMSWIIMATSHKTWEDKTQQILQKPRKERFLNSNSSPGLEQSLSPARLGELTMRVVLSLNYSAWHMWV